jgi:hypothetical protein
MNEAAVGQEVMVNLGESRLALGALPNTSNNWDHGRDPRERDRGAIYGGDRKHSRVSPRLLLWATGSSKMS